MVPSTSGAPEPIEWGENHLLSIYPGGRGGGLWKRARSFFFWLGGWEKGGGQRVGERNILLERIKYRCIGYKGILS